MHLVSRRFSLSSDFSHFVAVSLWGVAGLAETFPSFPVSGPFLPDAPGFQAHLTVSFHRNFGLPLGRFPSTFISTTALMFSVSSLLLTYPNHSIIISLSSDFTINPVVNMKLLCEVSHQCIWTRCQTFSSI